jgi:hypothetical protein
MSAQERITKIKIHINRHEKALELRALTLAKFLALKAISRA